MRDSESGIRRLFESILKQKEYDEQACRADSGRVWNNNQWSVAKNYLHQSILSTLMHRRRKELSAWSIRTHFQSLELLYEKELYRQCWKKLRQIERTLDKLDDPVLRSELFQWKYRLHSRNYHQVPLGEYEALDKDYLQNNQALQEYLHGQYLYQRFFFLLRNKGLIQKRENLIAAFEEVMSDPLFADDATYSSCALQLICDHALGTWKYIQGSYKDALHRFRRVVDTMEKHKGWRLNRPGLYIAALYWNGICTFETLDFEEVRNILSKMDRLRADSAHNKARLFYYKAQLQRSEVSIFGDAEANLTFARQTLKEMDVHQDRCRPAEVMNLLFNMGLTFLVGGSVDEAMHCYLKVLQSPVLKEVPEYELTTKMMLTLLCMEIGDQGLYRHYRRSLRRLLGKNPEAYPLENHVLDGLAEIGQARGEEARLGVLAALLKKVRVLEAASANRYFDFDAWFRSKSGEGTFREIYQKKAQTGII